MDPGEPQESTPEEIGWGFSEVARILIVDDNLFLAMYRHHQVPFHHVACGEVRGCTEQGDDPRWYSIDSAPRQLINVVGSRCWAYDVSIATQLH
jgi:hypothetical protein